MHTWKGIPLHRKDFNMAWNCIVQILFHAFRLDLICNAFASLSSICFIQCILGIVGFPIKTAVLGISSTAQSLLTNKCKDHILETHLCWHRQKSNYNPLAVYTRKAQDSFVKKWSVLLDFFTSAVQQYSTTKVTTANTFIWNAFIPMYETPDNANSSSVEFKGQLYISLDEQSFKKLDFLFCFCSCKVDVKTERVSHETGIQTQTHILPCAIAAASYHCVTFSPDGVT